MFCKKAYRETRWVDHILRVGSPRPNLDLDHVTIPSEREGWHEVDPRYLVRIKRRENWKTVKYIRCSRKPSWGMRWSKKRPPHLECRVHDKSAHIMKVYRRTDIFITNLTPPELNYE